MKDADSNSTESPPKSMKCKNHPDRDAAKECASCGEAFCEDCLSEYRGKVYCAPCLKAEVAVATARLGGGERELARMKKTLIGCSVVLLALVVTPMILLIYPCFKLGDVGRCRANLTKIYKALDAYARRNDGWFPADNNDLRPLFVDGYLKETDAELFRCPGVKGALTRTGSIRDSSAWDETFPPGMSYLYQGGLALPEKGKEGRPLLWDRSSRNHRGKGINVLYTDGQVKFVTKGLARLRLRRTDTGL